LAFGALYTGGGIVILLSLTAFGMIYLAYPSRPALRCSVRLSPSASMR